MKTIIVRREILPSGKSRPLLMIVLYLSITGVKFILIDIHSQQQTRELSDENVQFDIIDAIADNPANIQQYQALLKSYKADKTKLNFC
jgi:DNA repair protein RecN (Recombination protein N)